MTTTNKGRSFSGWVLGWGLLLAAAGSAGCTGGFDKTLARLKHQPITDVVPGIPSPAERMAALEKLRAKAGSAEPAEQEQISAELAAAFREESDPALRAEIVRTGAGYRTERAAGILRSAIDDPDADVRMAACEALGRAGDPEAVKLLSGKLASDVDNDVRLAAVAALGHTGDAAAVTALAETLEDRDPAMQYRAIQGLREITGEDLGNNVNQWRRYVRGEIPSKNEPVSIVQRFRQTL